MLNTTKSLKTKSMDPLEKLISDSVTRNFPKVGDFIKGQVVSVGKNEVIVDIPGITTGIVRGWELEDESGQMTGLNKGAEVQATVLDLENERGMMELSFRVAGHQKAWDRLKQLRDSREVVTVKALEANKGGLIIELGRVLGFLPVSQLNSEYYPRVEGGNKSRILDKLKEYVGQKFKVKVIDVNENDEKLIVSQKAVDEDKQMAALAGYQQGDELTVKITGIVDFGLFVEVPARQQTPSDDSSEDSQSPKTGSESQPQAVEGLVHISEVSWQRVDDLRELYQIGDQVKAKILEITNSKISLSIKRLQPDPWQVVSDYYQVGQIIKGKVAKINDFGAFVELAHHIHGLAHVSELTVQTDQAPLTIGESYDFKIINMEPGAHRLGLSRNLQATDSSDSQGTNQSAASVGEDKNN